VSSEPLLLTWYGDDFSGSTDVMEALSVRGVPSALFLKPPAPIDLQRFPEARAIGVAGISRGQTPQWMDAHLPPVFEALRNLGAPFCHYKLCSTFDSSPVRGSIGRAIEIGLRVFNQRSVAVVVGAPKLRRYVVFGNLFATYDGRNYRIDRHPVMARHPVTPMDEGDLRLHIQRQTKLSTALVDMVALQAGEGLSSFEGLRAGGSEIVFFDTLDAASMAEVGRAIWETRRPEPSFIAGSSGVEYGLIGWWDQQGKLGPQPSVTQVPEVDRLLVVSGSCSAVTASQIRWAESQGFAGIRLHPTRLVEAEAELERAIEEGSEALARGQSVIAYSATGPDDVVEHREDDFGQRLGARLGLLGRELLLRTGVRRMVVAGGDTSGQVGGALGIDALTMVRPFSPGSPLCRAWSSDPQIEGIEVLFKGGQVGRDTLFGEVKEGAPRS
jgi:3-oxoisoapionate kinase